MCQQDLRNEPLNPSGPGARSAGISLITRSVSCLVNGTVKTSRPSIFLIMLARLNFISCLDEVPSLSLKEWKRTNSLLTWSSATVPSWRVRDAILFLLYRTYAMTWKNLEFSSPKRTHRMVHLFFQYCFWYDRSLRMWVLRIDRKLVSGIVSLRLFSIASRLDKALLELLMALDRREMFLLQRFRHWRKCLNFLQSILALLVDLTSLSQAAWTVSMKPGWLIQ